jgi:hypothetical protein
MQRAKKGEYVERREIKRKLQRYIWGSFARSPTMDLSAHKDQKGPAKRGNSSVHKEIYSGNLNWRNLLG